VYRSKNELISTSSLFIRLAFSTSGATTLHHAILQAFFDSVPASDFEPKPSGASFALSRLAAVQATDAPAMRQFRP